MDDRQRIARPDFDLLIHARVVQILVNGKDLSLEDSHNSEGIVQAGRSQVFLTLHLRKLFPLFTNTARYLLKHLLVYSRRKAY